MRQHTRDTDPSAGSWRQSDAQLGWIIENRLDEAYVLSWPGQLETWVPVHDTGGYDRARAPVGSYDFRLDQIKGAGLVPIIEPEVDIHSPEKGEAEDLLKENIADQLGHLRSEQAVMLKLSLPDVDDFYADLVSHPNVLRVAALSGGYGRGRQTSAWPQITA